MKKLKIISFAVLALSLNSCRKDFNYVEPVIPPPAVVTFTDVYSILSDANYSCTGCHGAGGEAPNMADKATAYTSLTAGGFYDTANPAISKLYVSVTPAYTGSTGQMPGGSPYLSGTEQAKILKWIELGALNN